MTASRVLLRPGAEDGTTGMGQTLPIRFPPANGRSRVERSHGH